MNLGLRAWIKRAVPAIQRLPAAQQRRLLRVLLDEEHTATTERPTWITRISRWVFTYGVKLVAIGAVSAIVVLRVPMWVGICAFAVVFLPLLHAVAVVSQRKALCATAWTRLAQAGIPICRHCGHDLLGGHLRRCPTCAAEIQNAAVPPRIDGAIAIARPPDEPAPQVSRGANVVLFMVLLALALPMPFVMRAVEKTGARRQQAWHTVAAPADTIIEVESPDTFGFFVRADNSAEVVTDAAGEIPSGGLRIQLLDAATQAPLTLDPPLAWRAGRTWDTGETTVRLARRVRPAPGKYRLLVDGDPTVGPLCWRPRQMGPLLGLLAILVGPLLVGGALFGVGVWLGVFHRKHDPQMRGPTSTPMPIQ